MDQPNSTFSSNCSSIDDFRNQVYSTVYSIITVFGLVGNGFALYVLLRTYRQSSAFHIYMLNLAVADLLCVSTLPLRVLYYVKKGQWDLGDFLCRVSSYALYVNLYCSIFFMMAMSFTRFMAIVFPVQNLRLATERRARIVCACIWIFICTTSSPFLFSGQHFDPKTNKTKCFEPPEERGSIQKLVMLNYFSLVVGFAIPFLVILLCYAGIVRALLRNANGLKKQRNTRKKAIRMIVVVMLAFLISFMPYHIQRTVHLQFKKKNTSCEEINYMQKSVVITLCLAAANSCFDPMLYFFSGENFRHRLSTFRKASVNSGNNQRSRHLPPAIYPLEESELNKDNNPSKLG
ncbi:cysteinyl leukotriene receptor 1 [Pygocentrus nattereri]|uniref:Cysteinyl leukotriene receptor 1 n=1 Tax=Pygocentrus nattereri TaxID=42514 RepID=A0A3B4C1H6_PYGNA|nr:cysteinyl leukotriene receptor 1 [Pygocentrus nattereri]